MARALEAWLERLHGHLADVPRDAALRVCRDGSDFKLNEAHPRRPGETAVQATLRHYLARSRYLVVLCSPGAAASRHVNDEIGIFLRGASTEEGPPEDRVILAVTQGSAPASSPQEVFPPAVVEANLHEKIWIDLRGVSQSRRRDAEAVRDFEEERLVLAARLYGTNVEAISPYWYRSEKRRLRRLLGGLLVGAAVVTALAVGLFFFWRSAVKSARETRDTLRMALVERHRGEDLELSAAYLLDVEDPESTESWSQRAREHLRAPLADTVWRHEKLELVGNVHPTGDGLLAYSLSGSWHLFPPDSATGCAIGFDGDPLGSPALSASGDVAFVQRSDKLFRFEVSCASGDRDGPSFEESRGLVTVWGDSPVLAESATHWISVHPDRAPSSLEWHLPFECASVWSPVALEDGVLTLCQGGRVLRLRAEGEVEALEVPAGCTGKVGAAAPFAHGILYSVGPSLCRASAATAAVMELPGSGAPIAGLATNPAGTVVGLVDTEEATYRMWSRERRLERLDVPGPDGLAVDSDGLLALVHDDTLEWISPDGHLRGTRPLPDRHLHDLVFLADGRLVAAYSDDLRVWNGTTLRRSLVPRGQILHLCADRPVPKALYLVDDRLAVFDPDVPELSFLPEDRHWTSLTTEGGWIEGACPSAPTDLCVFDACRDDTRFARLGGLEQIVEAIDVHPDGRWMAWIVDGRLKLRDLERALTVSGPLAMPEWTLDIQVLVLDGGRASVLFTTPAGGPNDGVTDELSTWLASARAEDGKLVIARPAPRPGVLGLTRLEGEPDLACQLRGDGWIECDGEIRLRMPDIVVETPGKAELARAPRPPDGVGRIDADRFVGWSSDRACVFRRSEPERCRELGFTGLYIHSVDRLGGRLALTTLDGAVSLYDLDRPGIETLTPDAMWLLDEIEQIRVDEDRVWVGNDDGVFSVSLSLAELSSELRDRIGVCVPAGRRMIELGEDREIAERRYLECLDRPAAGTTPPGAPPRRGSPR